MKNRTQVLLITIAFIFSFGLTSSADMVQTTFLGNLAVDGYDPVAYFTQGKPVKGKSEFTFAYKDANWRFSSLENLNAFKAAPNKYAPQYGGYCAWAVAMGKKADGNPMNWTIHNNELYLNYNDSIQSKWMKQIESFIEKGDQNWPL